MARKPAALATALGTVTAFAGLSVAFAPAVSAAPSCVDVYLGNTGAYKYAKVTNNCSYDVDGVKTTISWARDGPCFYLEPGDTRIDRYGLWGTYQGLAYC